MSKEGTLRNPGPNWIHVFRERRMRRIQSQQVLESRELEISHGIEGHLGQGQPLLASVASAIDVYSSPVVVAASAMSGCGLSCSF